jgi:arylsulfatase A-like enzyme
MYEHSMKPPLIVVGPSVPKGKQRDALVYLQDIMATTLDLAGVEPPDYIEFNSLMPLIKAPKAPSHYDAIYGCYTPTLQRMIRIGSHKLIVYPKADVMRLYDLDKDPHELNDLAGDPEHQPLIAKLYKRLIELQKDMGDPLKLSGK